MPVPPKLVRRLVVGPLVLLVELLLVLLAPLLALVALLASPFFGGLRPLRLLGIVLAYAARHLGATLACLGLWVVRAGRREHYAVMRWFLAGIKGAVVGAAKAEVRVIESPAAIDALASHRKPLLVFSRHEGSGDSLAVLHELCVRHGRNPRVVMHEKLRLDPLVDVLGHRLPNQFVDPRGGDVEEAMLRMAQDLGPHDAVLIFPEGGNVSEARRARAIQRLEEGGHRAKAAIASAMPHLMAPRPGGVLTLLDAAPTADVVFVGHVGVPADGRTLWDLLPHEQLVEVRLWVSPRLEIPTTREARIDWLFDWWRVIDEWVGERGPDVQERASSGRSA